MKERLTGAAVLVILGVILIPLLLDGPDPDAPSGRVADPGRQIIEIKRGADKPAGPGTSVQAVAGVESEPEPEPEPEPRPAARAPTPADRSAPAAASGSTLPPAQDAQDAQPVTGSARSPTAAAARPKPATPAPKPTAQPARKPTPQVTAPAAAPPSAGGGWAIQIGSFGSRENADRLKRQLDGEGYPVFLMPVRSGGRTLHRVRVGPYRDRATADEVARRLAAAGPGGTVVRHGG